MYAWGAALALALSFVVVAVFVTSAGMEPRVLSKTSGFTITVGARSIFFARLASTGALTLCILSGFLGTQAPFENVNMTLFWIVFVLCVPYLVAVLGDFYSVANPWDALASWLEAWLGRPEVRVDYPAALGYFPAVLVYFVFIWLELFGRLSPDGLSLALLCYTAYNLVGSLVFGREAWFRHCELFGVIQRLIGGMAPLEWQLKKSSTHASPKACIRLRPPFVGLLAESRADLSLAFLILFMLASTAFDGLHSTVVWVSAYWSEVFPHIASWLGGTRKEQIAVANKLYRYWDSAWLGLSPGVYLVVFAVTAASMKWMTKSAVSVRTLVTRFALTLVPIAFVYHFTHYYTLVFSQGGQLVRLASDPLGRGWNLFGSARAHVDPYMFEINTVWHTQVGMIVAGHIASVWLAHREAARLFPSRRSATFSQMPMLVLMVLFTAFGLWILSVPLASRA